MNFVETVNLKNTNKYWAFLLCLLPILDPYLIGIGGLMIVEFLAIVIFLWAIISNRVFLSKSFSLLLITFFILSLVSALFSRHGKANYVLQFKVLIFQIINLVAFGFLWRKISKENFLKAVVVVGVIAASLAIIQFVAVTLGFRNFYTGQLPFEVGENNHFGGLFDRNTGDLRVHSFFEEPSYLALFELPVFAYCLKSKRIKSAIIVGISCILTASMLGVFGVLVAMVYIIFADKTIKAKQKAILLLIIGIVIVAGIFLYGSNSTIRELVDYQFGRITTIDSELERTDSSASLRLLGNIEFFARYDSLNKIVGVGFNQYAVYFDLSKNYSNDFVTTLLDFGIIGFVALLICLATLFNKIDRDGKIYFIMFVIALAVDHIWFNIYFFYLLSWCMFHLKKNDCVHVFF